MKPIMLAAAFAAASLAASPARAQKAAVVRLVIDTTGTEVRYRVRERLMGRDLDNDAVGVTRAVTGQIALGPDGSVLPDESRITIDVTSLKSDQDRRDNYVRRRLLVTDSNPTVVFAPTAIKGGPKSIPTSGSATFTIVGNLTVKGVTKPTTWTINARYLPASVVGTAATAFTFSDFSITQPRVPILLSVADTIRLEGDLNFAVMK
jgi:polyisoprenoid-binding protein YceI